MSRPSSGEEPRTLLFVANYSATVGYAWQHIERLFARVANRLAARGIRTFVAYPEVPAHPPSLEGSAAIPVELDVSLDARSSRRRARSFIRRRNVKVLYLTDRAYRSLHYSGLRLAGLHSIIVHDRTSGERTVPTGVKRWLKWIAAHLPAVNADRVIGVSDFVARRLREVALVPPERVVRIYNGFPVTKPDPSARRRTRERFGVEPDQPVVAAASRASPEKGIDRLFRAFDRLLRFGETPPERRPVLIFLGEGPQLPDLEALRNSLPARNEILLGGYQPRAMDLLEGADLFVVPSVWQDALPSAVLEPMARGRPVIATHVGGVPEMIEDGVSGLLVPPDDVKALATAMQRLLRDPDEAARLGAAAQDRVAHCFTFERQLDQVSALIEAAMGLPAAETAEAADRS